MFKVGSDIGGTFTDTVFWNEVSGDLTVGKVLTVVQDPSKGVINGLAEIMEGGGLSPEEVSHLTHGTTLAANAVIERKGAETGLITSRGFRDYLETGKEKRYDLYDNSIELPEPLVPRRVRRGINERLDEQGKVIVPLDADEVEAVIKEFLAEGVNSIAVCLLHSFRNAVHERKVAEIIHRLAADVYVSLSVEVVPEIREYERGSTTVTNAYVQPLMAQYLGRMEEKLAALGFGGSLHIMLSNGGITTSETAKRFPIRVVESGPAAGAIAAAFYGDLAGIDRLISFDMGGTTAKICFIEDGKPTTTREFEVARVHRFKRGSGFPIKLPVIDMIEIGAGGGSIARADRMGLLKVGPDSAGADPGPACYKMGGEEPTVTDADLVLGYLNPDYFLGGKMGLSLERARETVQEKVAQPLGISLVEAAWGIHQVVNENMANAARVHAAEKGKDERNYTLIAFGGAGPIHAVHVAKRLGMTQVIVPLGCGATSALGLLAAPFSFDFVHTYMASLDELDFQKVNELLGQMEEEGARLLSSAGVPEAEITLQRSCDMRYLGQGHEIQVPIPSGRLGPEHLGEVSEAFDSAYRRLYHRTNEGYTVECLNWRVVASGPKPRLNLKVFPASPDASLENAVKRVREVYFPEYGDFRPCTTYDRYSLFEGATFPGPAIIEERESTVVAGPGWRVTTDKYLNLLIRLQD